MQPTPNICITVADRNVRRFFRNWAKFVQHLDGDWTSFLIYSNGYSEELCIIKMIKDCIYNDLQDGNQ